MKRKLYSTATALMLVLSMTACSAGKGTPASSAPADTQESGTEAQDTAAAESTQAAADASTMEGWGNLMKEQYDGTRIVGIPSIHRSLPGNG